MFFCGDEALAGASVLSTNMVERGLAVISGADGGLATCRVGVRRIRAVSGISRNVSRAGSAAGADGGGGFFGVFV